MIKQEACFWHHYDETDDLVGSSRTIFERTHPEEFIDFLRGSAKIYTILQEIEADLIFVPLRGAGTINWVVEKLEEVHGRPHPFRVFLPVGTHHGVCAGDVMGGLSKPEKLAVIQAEVSHAQQVLGQIRQPTLVDEVQTGGTIKTTAHFIRRTMDQLGINEPLFVLALQDDRYDIVSQKKAGGYSTLISNQKTGLIALAVNMPLITSDRQELLDYLLYPQEAPLNRRILMQHHLHNTGAELLIKELTVAALFPEKLDKGIKLAVGEELFLESHHDEETRSLSELIGYLLQKSMEPRRIMDWLSEYSYLASRTILLK